MGWMQRALLFTEVTSGSDWAGGKSEVRKGGGPVKYTRSRSQLCAWGLIPAWNPLKSQIECFSEWFFGINYSGIVMYQLQNLSGRGRPLGLQPPTRPRPPPAASEEALSQNSWEALALGKTGPAGQGVVHWSWSQDTGRADGTGHSTKGREGAAVPSESMISVAFHRRQEAPALPPPTTFQVLTEVTTGKKRGFLCCDTSKQSDIICYGKRSQQIKTLTHQTNLHTLQTTPSARTKQIKAFCPHDKLPSYDFFSHFNMSKIGMS